MRELYFGSDYYQSYFKLVPFWYSNSFQQLVHATLNQWIKPDLLTKITASVWLVLFLMLTRSLIIKLNNRADYRPFLIFPFAYSLPFVLGDFNMLWGIVVVLLIFHTLFNFQEQKISSTKAVLSLVLLLLWAFLAHWSATLISTLFISLFLVSHPNRTRITGFAKTLVFPVLVGFGLCVLNFYFLKFQFLGNVDFYLKLKDWVLLFSLVTFSESEQIIIYPIAILFHGLMVFVIYTFFKPSKSQVNLVYWLRLLSINMLLLFVIYLLLPNNLVMNKPLFAGIQIYSVVMLVIALACIRLQKRYMIPLALVFLVVSIIHLKGQFTKWEIMGQNALQYQQVIEHISDKSIVFTDVEAIENMEEEFPFLIGSKSNSIVFALKSKADLHPIEIDTLARNLLNQGQNSSKLNHPVYLYRWIDLEDDIVKEIDSINRDAELIWKSSNNRGILYKIKSRSSI